MPRPAEPSREESRPRPTSSDLERIDAFLCDFLLPMLCDGRIAEEEEIPLAAAYHAYGIDAFNSWHVLGRAQDRIQFGVPGYTRSFTRIWARIQLHTQRLAREDFLRTREWLEEQARQDGVTGLHLPDSDPGTTFAPVPADRSCVERFSRLLETMRASNMPVVPPTAHKPSADPALAGTLSPPPRENSDSPATAELPAPSPDHGLEENGNTTKEECPPSQPAPPPVPMVVDAEASPANAELIIGQARRLREEAPRILAGFRPLLDGAPLPGFLFDRFRSGAGDQAVVVESAPEQLENLWFIGDLHGDLAALETALAFIDSQAGADPESESPSPAALPRLVFLGDLFDDGAHGYEVILRLMELAVERPGRITLVAGNHDEALEHDDEGAGFRSSVSPSDFTEWLNLQDEDSTPRRVAAAFVELMKRAPRALFFPDGLFAAHAGIPLSDTWEQILSREDLNRPQCLQDFVWTRAHPRARRKIPNRTTRGCEFGHQDLEGFCELAARLLERPVERMIRGHDHVEERFQFYPRYERTPLLTINTLSHRLPREVFGPYLRTPCVARFRWGQMPLVHRLKLDPEVLRTVYPEPFVGEEPGEGADEPVTTTETVENNGSS